MEGGGKGSRARLVLILSHSFSSDFNMQYMAQSTRQLCHIELYRLRP